MDFDANAFCELAYEGFLTTSMEVGGGTDPIQVLLPWIAVKRNSLDWKEVHINRSTAKRAKKYYLTTDQDYDGVMLGCIRQHGT